MTDTPAPNQTNSQEADPELMNPEDLDKVILSEDPAFADELKKVQGMVVDGNVNLDFMDLDGNYEPPNPWKDTIGWRSVAVKVFPFLPVFWDKKYRFIKKLRQLRSSSKDIVPLTLAFLKKTAHDTSVNVKEAKASFAALPKSKKMIAITLVLATVFTLAFVYRSYTSGVLPGDKELIIASLQEWADVTYKYDPETEMDSFYDSPRTIQNIMSLPKMVVNIQPSHNSGSNPMAAMEFFLEGMNADSIVEVKDREVEVVDLFQRTLETMTFDELDSAEGKHLLTQKLRQAVNLILTKGKIRRVFIKESVIKP